MPAHVRAADAPEDLWRCHECGWTYPNHHPSAKHRRNHKKQCGKLPGFTKTTDLKANPQLATGSSDDGSSDEEHHRLSHQAQEVNGHHQELSQSPSPAAAANVEQVSRSLSDVTQSDDGGAAVKPKDYEETSLLSTRDLDLSTSKDVAETANGSDKGRSRTGSAQARKGQWICRHCGWAYPNAHPSAKNRRKHKKICGIAASLAGPGGSSDEASSDEDKNCGIPSNARMETEEPLECNLSGAQGLLGAGTVNGASANAIDPSQVVEGQGLTDVQKEVPLKPDSSNSQVPFGTTSMHGVSGSNGLEKLDVGDSQVAQVDDGSSPPNDEQAPSTPDIGEAPLPPIDDVKSNQAQALGEIRNSTVSNRLKSTELDGTVIDQHPQNVITEQVEQRTPNLCQHSQPLSARENVGKTAGDQEIGDSETIKSQSRAQLAITSQRGSVGSPQPEMKNGQPKSATRTAVGGESLTNGEVQTPPQSPEGLVRSRVQIFEKLAGTSSPQYLRKSVSPSTNSPSPRLPRSFHSQNNGTTDSKSTGSPGHKQSSQRGTQSASKQGGPNELQEVMSHLRHRGSFVRSECSELPGEGA